MKTIGSTFCFYILRDVLIDKTIRYHVMLYQMTFLSAPLSLFYYHLDKNQLSHMIHLIKTEIDNL